MLLTIVRDPKPFQTAVQQPSFAVTDSALSLLPMFLPLGNTTAVPSGNNIFASALRHDSI